MFDNADSKGNLAYLRDISIGEIKNNLKVVKLVKMTEELDLTGLSRKERLLKIKKLNIVTTVTTDDDKDDCSYDEEWSFSIGKFRLRTLDKFDKGKYKGLVDKKVDNYMLKVYIKKYFENANTCHYMAVLHC